MQRDHLTIWRRGDGYFYPVEMMPPEECGKTIEAQVLEHVEMNPGTTGVDDMDGNPIWRPTND